jgi:hypothetical protein
MRTLTLRRAAAAAVLPLALGSLSACGGSSSDGGTATDAQAGPTSPTPTASGSSTAPAVKHLSGAAFLAMIKDASEKITTARFSMSMDVSGQSIPVTGVIDLTGDSPAMRMSVDLTGMGTPSDMLLVGKAMYVGVPGSGGKFYKIDLSDPNGPMGGLNGGTFDNLDPNSMMSSMSPRVFSQVTDRGVTTVGGQWLHHYTVRMNLHAAGKLPNLPATAQLPRSASYDAWLDSQGRMARFTLKVKNAVAMSARYSDYGTAAHIVAPPAADILAMPGTATSG